MASNHREASKVMHKINRDKDKADAYHIPVPPPVMQELPQAWTFRLCPYPANPHFTRQVAFALINGHQCALVFTEADGIYAYFDYKGNWPSRPKELRRYKNHEAWAAARWLSARAWEPEAPKCKHMTGILEIKAAQAQQEGK
jgi:hypothetical protein